LALTMLPLTARAGGFEIPDNGTRAAGRGGAYAAAVAEPSAIYYNPAALSRIDGFAATLDANLWIYDKRFQRDPLTIERLAGEETTYPFSETESTSSFFPAPMLFLSYDFGLDDWGFGLGVYGPSAIGNTTFPQADLDELSQITQDDTRPRDWGHGYLIEEASLLVVYYSLAAAYDFGPVQVGITFQLAMLDITFVNAADGDGLFSADQNAQEAPSLYTRNTLDAFGLAPTGIIAVRYQPFDALTLALSYRPRVKFEADSELTVEFPPAIADQVSLTEPGALLTLTLPDVVRFGVRWAFIKGGEVRGDIELDAVYEAWSETDSFVTDIDGKLAIDLLNQERILPRIVIPKGYDDTLSLRLGGEAHLGDMWRVRAGTFFEGAANGNFFQQGTTREGYANIEFMPFRRVGLSLGGSALVGDFSIDLAYMHVFSKEERVEDGQIDILFPLWVCNDPQTQTDVESCQQRTGSPLHPVNEGTFDVTYDLVSLGVTYHLE
jgi:long-subunit fatty acid transport protein